MSDISRRKLLAGSAALLPLVSVSCSTPSAPTPEVLAPELNAILDAFADRILPPDATGPGAAASGVTRYINRSLAEWNQADVPLLSAGLQALETAARAQHAQSFTALNAAQQDELLVAMEAGQISGFDNAQAVFNRLHRLVLEGMFSDPYYGGNANYAGWDLIGYPGAVLGSTQEMQQMGGRLPPLHTSAYGEEHDGGHDGH
jgi:gluconate 2-dehydrogenase gamma chain